MMISVHDADRGAAPGAIVARRDDQHVVPGLAQRGRQDVNALGLDAVIVRDEDAPDSPGRRVTHDMA
jgi:hypothetical protein